MNHFATPMGIVNPWLKTALLVERGSNWRMEKINGRVARFLDSEQGQRIVERPLTHHKSYRVWVRSISGQFVAITQGSACTSPLFLLLQTPAPFPSYLSILPHTQPYNLGERFSGCFFYWIPNNAAVITVKIRRLGLLREPFWGQWDAKSGARVGGREVIGCFSFYTVHGKTRGNNHHIYRWLATLSGARRCLV